MHKKNSHSHFARKLGSTNNHNSCFICFKFNFTIYSLEICVRWVRVCISVLNEPETYRWKTYKIIKFTWNTCWNLHTLAGERVRTSTSFNILWFWEYVFVLFRFFLSLSLSPSFPICTRGKNFSGLLQCFLVYLFIYFSPFSSTYSYPFHSEWYLIHRAYLFIKLMCIFILWER